MSEDRTEFASTPNHEISPDKKVEDFISTGAELARQGEFEKVIKHFRDKEFAKSVGYHFRSSNDVFLRKTPTEAQARKIFYSMALFSHAGNYLNRLSIEISKVEALSQAVMIPPSLLHNTMLLHFEEWIHVLQQLRGNKPLTNASDIESDVPLYLYSLNVPLTDLFINKQGARSQIPKAT